VTHDHSRISAVLDDECSPTEREEVLAHVAGCPPCREFHRAERAAKAALRGTVPVSETAPAALLANLRALAPAGTDTSAPVPALLPAAHTGRPVELPDQHRRRVRRAAKGLGLALAGVGGLCAVTFALGDMPDVPEAHPMLTRFDDEHDLTVAATAAVPDRDTGGAAIGVLVSSAVTMERQPAVGPAVTAPASTLGGLRLRAVSVLDHGDVLHLTYGTGASAVSVFWQRGVLGRHGLGGFVRSHADGGDLLIRPGNPRVAVWSTGRLTVTVVGPEERVEAVTRALPHDPPAATGVVARIGRGMHRASGWVDPLD